MEIQIINHRRMRGLRTKEMEAKLARALGDLDFEDKELSVLLTDDAGISELNERYRCRVGPTNVLAFPQGDETMPGFVSDMLGDVVVSVETAAREAAVEGCSLESRVYRLLCHGLLHLAGYDHEKSEQEASRFLAMEDRLVSLQDRSLPPVGGAR